MADAEKNYNWAYVLLGIGILVLVIVLVKAVSGPSFSGVSQYTDPQRGGSTPEVTIVEYADFQCPSCQKMEGNLRQALNEFGDKVAVVYNDYPLTSVHPNAYSSAEAGQCALAQNKFWEYHDTLYDNQEEWSGLSNPIDQFITYASDLGLDADTFRSCLNNHETKSAIEEDLGEGESQQINSTPTLFVNGERYVGTGGYDSLRRLINKHLSSTTTNATSATNS